MFRVQASLSSESLISALLCVLCLYLWCQKSYRGTTTTPCIAPSIGVTVQESPGNSRKSLWLDWLKLHTHPQINPVVKAVERVIFSTFSLCLWNHIHTKGGVEQTVERSQGTRCQEWTWERMKEERAEGELDNNKANFILQLVQVMPNLSESGAASLK